MKHVVTQVSRYMAPGNPTIERPFSWEPRWNSHVMRDTFSREPAALSPARQMGRGITKYQRVKVHSFTIL